VRLGVEGLHVAAAFVRCMMCFVVLSNTNEHDNDSNANSRNRDEIITE